MIMPDDARANEIRGTFLGGSKKISHVVVISLLVYSPGKPQQNLKPYDLIAVLFICTFSIYDRSSLLTRSFRRIMYPLEVKWLWGPKKFPGLSRNRPL